MEVHLAYMKTLQIDVPKFGSHNRSITKQKRYSNAKILAIVEKLNSQPAKCVAIDFDVSIGYVYKLRENYVAKNGVLYRRVDDGN